MNPDHFRSALVEFITEQKEKMSNPTPIQATANSDVQPQSIPGHDWLNEVLYNSEAKSLVSPSAGVFRDLFENSMPGEVNQQILDVIDNHPLWGRLQSENPAVQHAIQGFRAMCVRGNLEAKLKAFSWAAGLFSVLNRFTATRYGDLDFIDGKYVITERTADQMDELKDALYYGDVTSNSEGDEFQRLCQGVTPGDLMNLLDEDLMKLCSSNMRNIVDSIVDISCRYLPGSDGRNGFVRYYHAQVVKYFRVSEIDDLPTLVNKYLGSIVDNLVAGTHNLATLSFAYVTRMQLGDLDALKERIESDTKVPMSLLQVYLRNFYDGREVEIDYKGKPIRGLLADAGLMVSWGVVNLIGKVTVIGVTAEGLVKTNLNLSTPFRAYSNGLFQLSELPIKSVSDEEKVELAKMGSQTVNMVKEVSYMDYTGQGFFMVYGQARNVNATGRVMVDPRYYFRESQSREALFRLEHDARQGVWNCEVDENELWMVAPFLPVYAMRLKRWVYASVNQLSSINFNRDALELLVIDEDVKHRLMKLVNSEEHTSVDLIAGKGAGTLILSEGGPGTGKTTTPEAIAEYLMRPTYYVTVGELGTNRDELENSLNRVLEVAEQWNAILILDEVDIFVRKRDGQNLERDAMTGIFLRMLEYYPGILFMSTNLVDSVDAAFLSRVNLVLHYGKTPERSMRAKVWVNLARTLKIEGFDPNALARYMINNRDVKNILNNTARFYEGEQALSQEILEKETAMYVKGRYDIETVVEV